MFELLGVDPFDPFWRQLVGTAIAMFVLSLAALALQYTWKLISKGFAGWKRRQRQRQR